MQDGKMSGWLFAIVAILVIIAIPLMMLVGRYNALVEMDEGAEAAWKQIDVQLKRRADLIPNLVATVQGYAAHEKEIFENIADARSRLMGARSPGAAAAASGLLDAALGRLLAIAEAYPDLKANQSFIRLQDELAGTENRIAVARRDYNEIIRQFNTHIRKFPTRFIASLFGFSEREYFEVPEGDASREAPSVDFGVENPG